MPLAYVIGVTVLTENVQASVVTWPP